MSDLLNDSQKFSVFVTLREFEERLRQAEAWLQGAEEQGHLYHRMLTLSPEQGALAQQHIAEALHRIGDLARTLELSATNGDVAGYIRASLSESWANLCDIRSDKLRRYGAVHPDLAAVLDATVERLAELALGIAALV